MGKMLIIRGATYTPSGSQDDPNSGNSGNTPSVNPSPQPTPQVYSIYYMSRDFTMHLDRSQASTINAVAIFVSDPTDQDVISVSADIPALQNAGAGAVVGWMSLLEKGGDSFSFNSQEWTAFVDMIQSGEPYQTHSTAKSLLIIISKSSYDLKFSSSEVDAIVAAVPTAITFDN